LDSGILHLAAAVGVRVVGLYGMSDPKATGPQGDGHATITAGLECSPCQLSTCKRGNECMLAIDKERVITAVESVG
jgi:heptosyltransferase-2